MAQLGAALAIVEGFRSKNYELFHQSNDGLHSLILRGFDCMTPILSLTPDRNHIQRVLHILDSDGKISVQYENSNADPARIVMFDFIESAHLTFRHLINKNDSQQALIDSLQAQINRMIPKEVVEQFTQTDEISLDSLKEEPVKIEEMEIFNENPEHPLHIENVNEVDEFPLPAADSLDGLSTIPRFTKPKKEHKEELVEPKEEPIDTTVPGDNQISDLDFVGDDMGFMEEEMLNDDVAIGNRRDDKNDLIEKEGEKEKIVDNTADTSKETSQTDMKRRRSSRNITQPLKYTESSEDSDRKSEPASKKSRSDSEKKKNNMLSSHKKKDQSANYDKDRVYKSNESDLECIECDYRTRSVYAWIDHLKEKHSTNLWLAGFALLCDCGNESLSDKHFRSCSIANFTVIRKRDGPIQRLHDEKTTPKCVLCEFYPSTPGGYTSHLQKHHKSNLIMNGIYLKCKCGLEVRKDYDRSHLGECYRGQFTLHQLDEE